MLALLKLAVVFAALLALLRLRLNVALVMLIAATGVGLLFGMPLAPFLQVVFSSVVSQPTIDLALAILLIMVLEGVLRESGLMRCLVDCLFGLVRDRRALLALLPSLIGFLPSPAWARFLGPVVEEMTADIDLSPVRKAFITYWYQHVTAYVSPLFPALILGASLAGLPIASLILALAPVAAMALVLGAPLAFAGVPGGSAKPMVVQSRWDAFAGLLKGIAPVGAVIGLVLFQVNVALALALVAGAVALLYRYSPARILAISRRTVVLGQVLTVVAIMVFKDVLVASGALREAPEAMAALGLPLQATVLGVALLAGLLTGSTNTSVAMSVPMLAALPGGATPAAVALAFVWGFAGLMLTPTHPCLVLTLQHFRTTFAPVQRLLVLPQAVLVAAATLLLLLRPV